MINKEEIRNIIYNNALRHYWHDYKDKGIEIPNPFLGVNGNGALSYLVYVCKDTRKVLFPYSYHLIAPTENPMEYLAQRGARVFRFNINTGLLEQLVDDNFESIGTISETTPIYKFCSLEGGEIVIEEIDSQNHKRKYAIVDRDFRRLSEWYDSISHIEGDQFEVAHGMITGIETIGATTSRPRLFKKTREELRKELTTLWPKEAK